MGAAALALAPLEIAVAGRGAALSGSELVWIHAEAHRTTGCPPLESGSEEHPVESFGFSLGFDLHRPRHNDAGHGCRDPAPFDHRSGKPQVFDAAVGA